MAEEILTCKEHEDFHKEYARRVDAEDERQNARINLLEENTKQINALALSDRKNFCKHGKCADRS